MIVPPLIDSLLELHQVLLPAEIIRVVISRFDGVGQVEVRGRDVGEPEPAVPRLEHDFEEGLVDHPGRGAQHVQPGVDELEVAGCGGLGEVLRLLERVFYPHHAGCGGC